MKSFMPMKLKHGILVITSFAIAMGYLEAAVVVYLRTILYPEGFSFPLSPIPGDLALTELLREAATLIMLVTVGMVAARRFSMRFAWFLYSFAIWDIFYYVFLKLLLGWPESLMTWDILFLIPTTWTGPVIAPVMVSLTMILLALAILLRGEQGRVSKLSLRVWLGLIGGSLVLIFAFIFDYTRFMLVRFSFREMFSLRNQEVLATATQYIPDTFPWWIFAAGEVMILFSILWYWRKK